MKSLLLPVCCLGWLFVQPLHAQVSDLSERKETGRRAWIVSTSIPEDVGNPLLVLSNERMHEVTLYLRGVGEPIPVDKTGVVRAVKARQKADGTQIYEDLARCVMAEGISEALIVLVPKGGKEDGLRFDAKVIDLSRFKAGGCLYINLVKTKVGVTFGDMKTVVPPGGMEFMNMLEEGDKAVNSIRFFYEIPKKPKAEWKLMTASRMAVYASRREICIFYYNPEIENIDFRGMYFMTPRPMPKER